jgi:putative toxin-antitoxin system antitoxin component (TIGR02293 family)
MTLLYHHIDYMSTAMTTSQNQLLASLGLPPDALTNQVKYIHAVREGISGEVVKRAVKILGNRDLFVRLLDTTSSNLSRYYRIKNMSRVDSEEMLDTIRLYDQAYRLFGDMDKTKEWIQTPLAVFNGERPEALFDTFEGRNWISRVLRKIEYGEFV